MASDLLIPQIRVDVEEDGYARIVAEPLEPGFGTTLGNALRRILLSSLPGAAITSVRIEGVEHEFSTLEYMKEDVTEFLLNLKGVRLRAYADRPARLFLESSGESEITAGMIQCTADYEIVNPDLHLASLDDQSASVVVDINVETGRGFLPAVVTEELAIGVIPVDAIFTPVRRVNYNVSHTRVGQATNYDRLDLEVWTDGSVSGEDAVALAAEILREQMMPFHRLGRPGAVGLAASEGDRHREGYDTPIEALGLSSRAFNCLKRSGLQTVGAVLEKSEEELLSLRNFGDKSYGELRERLVENGFSSPRKEARRPTVATAETDPEATPEPEPDAPAEAEEGSGEEDSVSALGHALMEALREAGADGAARP
ncbi:MAG: DNA-directed RNA polymerase subunit alpha [Chloroflexi bacterium]|nr:DNA-directed RNA polymerase subunit alpha [Chloroflexota bacterium]